MTDSGAELARVLSNLIDNAIEALPQNRGTVTLGLYSSPRESTIVVRDTGKGMTPELVARLGSAPISQGKDGKWSGSGLGVYSAKRAVEAMGGKMRIQSRAGEGTIVTVQLPTVASFADPKSAAT